MARTRHDAGSVPTMTELTLLVRETVHEADGVLGVVLADPRGADLPPWTPGAHLEVRLPSGRIRHYSLTGDPEDRTTYRLGVLRERNGRGGSEEIHTTQLPGTLLTAKPPVNRFPLTPADHYLFIAGGIGITPILPMIRRTAATATPWTLLYGGRTLSSMAYRRELRALAGEDPGRVTIVPQDTQGLLDLDRALKAVPATTAVYCCGPPPLIEAVRERCVRVLPAGTLHVERFTAPDTEPRPPTGEFEVELRRTGKVLHVPPGRTLLDVVREAIPTVAYSCEEGMCGTCETKVLAGVPEHHDTVLTEEERRSGTTMMICVGRAKTSRLVLDL
jgi:ferredoxin-NADP reductase